MLVVAATAAYIYTNIYVVTRDTTKTTATTTSTAWPYQVLQQRTATDAIAASASPALVSQSLAANSQRVATVYCHIALVHDDDIDDESRSHRNQLRPETSTNKSAY